MYLLFNQAGLEARFFAGPFIGPALTVSTER